MSGAPVYLSCSISSEMERILDTWLGMTMHIEENSNNNITSQSEQVTDIFECSSISWELNQPLTGYTSDNVCPCKLLVGRSVDQCVTRLPGFSTARKNFNKKNS